jgi:hypothetical protein
MSKRLSRLQQFTQCKIVEYTENSRDGAPRWCCSGQEAMSTLCYYQVNAF